MILVLAFFVALCAAAVGVGIDAAWYSFDLLFGLDTLTEDRGVGVVILSVVVSQIGLFGSLIYVLLPDYIEPRKGKFP